MESTSTKQSIVPQAAKAVRATSGERVGSGKWGIGSRERAGQSWQEALKTAVRQPRQLLEALGLAPELLPAAERAAKSFGLFAPFSYIARMKPRDPLDPLLRQVLPLRDE